MTDLPVVEPPVEGSGRGPHATGGGPDRVARVAGVLLAAGTSTRFGETNKLLEPVGGEPMVRRTARTLLEAGLDPVVIVVGHEAERVRDALAGIADVADAEVSFAENPDYAEGLATSVGAGVAALPDGVDAAVFALADMPWVAPASVRRLVDAYRAGAGTALAAAHAGARGNPVLWDAGHFPALADREGDVGGRALLARTPDAALVETGDPGVRRDIDRREDLE